VREELVKCSGRVNDMHRCAVQKVCAHAQSEALLRVEDMLSEEEALVVKRARNAHQTPPKGAVRAEYHRATALEALIGYLYVTGHRDRMREILDAAVGDADER
jgi:ribonuclease-3 family protein